MFGGGGMNPKKMEQMMEQMGIDMDELDATEVMITLADGTQLVFGDPEVTKMDARGEETYQVVGDAETVTAEEPKPEGADTESSGESSIPDADVEIVVQRTGVPEAEAREAIEAADGDLAAAIDSLE
ncbi:nascent polypeptide-associated complex protein [Halodesulfurarchaeum sp.]|uniref:nascent polypeptide-associated complex protein n=1 Tax=Halodesulfurarchaeum sp. TaxID=1980530 RepID=UPI001BB92CDD|nr:nascent polypeptide-associated complex protein [Halodesulfurarchaeum sp.]